MLYRYGSMQFLNCAAIVFFFSPLWSLSTRLFTLKASTASWSSSQLRSRASEPNRHEIWFSSYLLEKSRRVIGHQKRVSTMSIFTPRFCFFFHKCLRFDFRFMCLFVCYLDTWTRFIFFLIHLFVFLSLSYRHSTADAHGLVEFILVLNH